MPKIIPIRDLKNTSRISELCHSNDQPIFITKNGYEDMVIMSMASYDRLNFSHQYNAALPEQRLVAEPSAAVYGASGIYTIQEIADILRPVFDQYKVKKATLFGSYAKGTAHSKSDVDILVDSGLKGLKFFGLLNSVAEALRFPVDLIDTQEIIHGSEIEQEIKETGIVIYE